LENPRVFKSDLDSSDFIDLAKLPGYGRYNEGIKIDLQTNMKPIANNSLCQVSLPYMKPANKLYQDMIDQKVVRHILPNEVCE
jgi:hypothetical protein